MTDLKTGDLILFCGKDTGWLKYFSEMIKYTSHSNYSHVGMILKDPTFIHPMSGNLVGKANPIHKMVK